LSYIFLIPEIIVITASFLILLLDLFLPKNKRGSTLKWFTLKGYLAPFSILCLVLAFLLSRQLLDAPRCYIGAGILSLDPSAVFFKLLLLACAFFIVLMSVDYFKKSEYQSEYYVLLFLSLCGCMLVTSANNLIAIYLGLELASIPTYILAAFWKKDPKSSEAAIKYFLLGVLASVVMLYGFSLLYGLTGSTNLGEIVTRLEKIISSSGYQPYLLSLVMILAVFGLGIKISAVPFHFRLPDAYEGAPTPVTAYLSIAPKIAGFAIILRIFFTVFSSLRIQWTTLFLLLSVASMSVGNLMALTQENIKRMLAYSSIAHTGYILVGFAVAKYFSLSSVLLYFTVYMLANLGAFAVVIFNSSQGKGDLIKDYAGLNQKAPLVALAMSIFLFSLAGIPPLGGFIGKLYLFSSALRGGYAWLAVVGILNSVISLYYYLGVVRQMYLSEPIETTPAETFFSLNPSSSEGADEAPRLSFRPIFLAIFLLLLAVIAVGVYPSPLIELAERVIPQ